MAGGADHRDLADGHALGGELALQEEVEARLVDVQPRGVARAFLRQDDPAFAVDGALVEQQLVGAFAEQHQRGVQAGLVG